MNRYIYKIAILLALFYVSCDNANDLVDQYIENGPITYAAKINELNTQSGYYRFRVNLFPAEDVNRSYCMLGWNITEMGAQVILRWLLTVKMPKHWHRH